MKYFKRTISYVTQVTLFLAGLMLILTLSFDALEWETTGSCYGCVLLPEISSRFVR